MNDNAKKIVSRMYNYDSFSQWLGIEILEQRPGYCKTSLVIREEMTNGFNIAHGGISYSLADSALAFASNAHGEQQVSLETSISHTKPCHVGDRITAIAKEINQTKKTAIYEVLITNQHEELVAHFKGIMYNTQRSWDLDKE